MTHALVIAENREEIVRIFQWWRMSARSLDVEVHELGEQRGEGVAARQGARPTRTQAAAPGGSKAHQESGQRRFLRAPHRHPPAACLPPQ